MTENQKNCNHVFVGKADGVHCKLCGLHLTPEQYHELLHPPKQAQDGDKSEADNQAATAEKSEQAAKEPAKTKAKRTTKKKEAATGE